MFIEANTDCIHSVKHKFELCLDTERAKSIPDVKRINYMDFRNIKPFTINDDYVIETNLSVEDMNLDIQKLSSSSFSEEWLLEDDEYWNNYIDA